MRDYIACAYAHESATETHDATVALLVFRNPDDPSDTSFEPHPTHYPVAELEYPNTGAWER